MPDAPSLPWADRGAGRTGRERGGGQEWAEERNHWLFAAGLVLQASLGLAPNGESP